MLGCVTACASVARQAIAADAPPPEPYRRGPNIDGGLGVYGPLGRLHLVSSPGPWMRIAAGYELNRWLGVFVGFDTAFLSTDRTSPPPGERGYVLWGFSGGVRFGIPLGNRWRIPFRAEIGAHKADDNGVLATYGFLDAHSFGLSLGAATGLEWRAMTRHFGLALEGGVRTDASLQHAAKAQTPLAITGVLLVRYTL